MKYSAFIMFFLLVITCRTSPAQVVAAMNRLEKANQTVDEVHENPVAVLVAAGSTSEHMQATEVENKLRAFVAQMREMKSSVASERQFLRLIFDQGRSRFFLRYEQYPPFYKLFTDGTYNCLTGSAFYSLVLTQLGYSVSIHETALHVYIKVKSGKREYLMDGTDAVHGFVSGAAMIRQREDFYAANERQKYQPYFNREITLAELCGLAYYNEATIQYNQRNYRACARLLESAARLYSRSERVRHLKHLTMQSSDAVYTAMSKESR